MSLIDDHRTAAKLTPEEEIDYLKGRVRHLENDAVREDRHLRKRVFTAVWEKSASTPSDIRYLVDDVDQAVQYILHGKEDVLHPFDVPHVSLDELKSILMESLVTDLSEGKLRDGYIQCMKDVCKGVGLSTDFIE